MESQRSTFMTVAEISMHTGINHETIRTWIKRNKVPSGKNGNSLIADLNTCILLGVEKGIIEKNEVEKKIEIFIKEENRKKYEKKLEESVEKEKVKTIVSSPITIDTSFLPETTRDEAKTNLVLEQYREKKIKNDLLEKDLVRWSDVREEFNIVFSGELDCVSDLIEKILVENSITMNKKKRYFDFYRNKRSEEMKKLKVRENK